jgi:hypothetical protein
VDKDPGSRTKITPSLRSAGQNGKIPLGTWETQLIQSLKFPNMNGRFRTINKPASGTCLWLFDNKTYHDWLTGQNRKQYQGLLTVKGKPGAGKSVLTKEALRQATLTQSSSDHVVLRFFFNGKGEVDMEHSPVGMYSYLLCQLLEKDISLFPALGQALNEQGLAREDADSAVAWKKSELRSLLESLLIQPSMKRVFIFIDALDECDASDRRSVAYFWRELTNNAYALGVDLNVYISERTFPSTPIANCPEIVVDSLNRVDIESYVVQKFGLGFANAEPRWELLKEGIIDKSRGVFLWAVLVLEEILQTWDDEACNVEDLMDLLEQKIPGELQAMFSRSFLTMGNEARLLAMRLFEWAILPTKPLRLHEWHHILAFMRKPAPSSLGEWRKSKYFTKTDDQLERQIRTISRGLIEVVGWTEVPQETLHDTVSILAGAGSLDLDHGDTRVVQVIHESVREFFLQGHGFSALNPDVDPELVIGIGHISIMDTCLDYLNIKELDALVVARILTRYSNNKGKGKKGTKRKYAASLPSSPPEYSHLATATTPPRPLMRRLKRSTLSFNTLSEFDAAATSAKLSFGDEILRWAATLPVNSRPVSPNKPVMYIPVALDPNANSSVAGRSQLLEDDAALMSYVLFELFSHARAAQRVAAGPENIIDRLLKEQIWERWVLLREDIPNDTALVTYCVEQGLSTWIPEYQCESSKPNFFRLLQSIKTEDQIPPYVLDDGQPETKSSEEESDDERFVYDSAPELGRGRGVDLGPETRKRRREQGSVASFSSAGSHVGVSSSRKASESSRKPGE